MFTLSLIPLSVLNRALDLFNADRQTTTEDAWDALQVAEGSKDVTPHYGQLTPFSQAIAEYMSSTDGPVEGGEYDAESGYRVNL